MKSFNAADPDRNRWTYDETSQHSIEVDSLVRSYNKMTEQIYTLIDELTEKADVERQLNQQKVDNLEIKSLLRKTELHMLQMQINPHFLFNTLNSIHALSVMENAENTAQMISRISKILRYSLRELDQLVTLSDELDNVVNYIELQKMRFGKRIVFHVNYDNHILDTKVPGMIIQPLIENSIMHAFNREGLNGTIWISIQDEIDYISISVRDNGLGINSETIQSLIADKTTAPQTDNQYTSLQHSDNQNTSLQHSDNQNTSLQQTGKDTKNMVSDVKNTDQTETHGIGLDNVIKRIRLLYGHDAFRIKSAPNQGTTIILKIGKRA